MMQNTEAEAYTLGVKDFKSWTTNKKSGIKFRVFIDKRLL